MLTKTKQYLRTYQFISGPNTQCFYACEKHKDELTKSWLMDDLFFATAKNTLEIIDGRRYTICDFCSVA